MEIRLYAGHLYNHDYLWFSSFEISKIASTIPLLHNYALSYAISGFSHGIYFGNTPQYVKDLDAMPAYATPARPVGTPSSTRFTQNAVNSATLRTGEKKLSPTLRGVNTPELGWRLVLDPVWADAGEKNDSCGFNFYLFARSFFRPPGVIRLGKKGCPIRLKWEEVLPAVAIWKDEVIQPTHAVNPLDVQGDIKSYEPVSIPPHLILRRAEIALDWFVICGQHKVHVPKRFTGG